MARMQEAGNRVSETDYIKIHGNCLEIENTVLQLKNISLFSTVDIDSHPFPMGVLLLIIAAIVSLFFKVLIAVVLFAISLLWIYFWNKREQELAEIKRLIIVTNSGQSFAITFSSQIFLKKVLALLMELLDHPNGETANITINVKDSTFSGSSSFIQQLNNHSF